ncbi:MAG: hypothetical protein JWO36_247 [Myxococcales bacterium]|nr:hypothetical protein [Myxococcales bacterium]
MTAIDPEVAAGCTRCNSPLEDGDLRCAVCALPVPVTVARPDQPRVSVLRCTECGAAISFDPSKQAPSCAFCRAVMKIEQPIDPIETARTRLRFSVDRDAATRSIRGWLGTRGYFTPRALRDEAVFESLTPLSWAGWVVNAKAMVAWTADSDDGARRSAWAPHAGSTSLELANIVVPASRGLRDHECSRLSPFYDLSLSEPVTPLLEHTETIESFDAQRSAARRFVQDAIEDLAKVRIEPFISGRRFRRIRVSCLLERQTTDRVALPAWVLAYRFRGSPYRAIVHGQREDIVVGTTPIDWAKVTRLMLAIVSLAVAIVAIVLVTRS